MNWAELFHVTPTENLYFYSEPRWSITALCRGHLWFQQVHVYFHDCTTSIWFMNHIDFNIENRLSFFMIHIIFVVILRKTLMVFGTEHQSCQLIRITNLSMFFDTIILYPSILSLLFLTYWYLHALSDDLQVCRNYTVCFSPRL